MELEKFIEEWTVDPANVKDVFITFKGLLESLADTEIEFNARPGITYSLRGKKSSQSEAPLFVMVDVIDDDPADRWLSVCFFSENITDAEELGDMVPGGLMGKDAHCFDVDTPDMKEYVAARISEAHGNQ